MVKVKSAPPTPKMPENLPDSIYWRVKPKEETWTGGTAEVWESKDGIFRAYRINSGRDGIYHASQFFNGTSWWCIEHEPEGPTYAKHYDSLNRAMFVCETWLAKKLNVDSVKSNREAVIDQIGEVAQIPQEDEPSPKRMKRPRKESKASPERSSHVLEGDGKKKESPKVEKTDKSTTPKGRGPSDKYGRRIGSQAADINTKLTGSWQTADQIIAKCGLPDARVRRQIIWMLKRGFVEKNNDSYRLKK